MRQVWRVLSTLRLPTLCEQGLVARQSYALATFRSLWKPAFQPLPSRFVHWRTPPLPQPQPRPQLEQCRTFASKVKKYKMKSYTAFKGRFKLKANGEYKRWRAGKRHNAHSKVDATELKMVGDPRPEAVERQIRDEQEQILRELHRELESVDRRVTRSRARASSMHGGKRSRNCETREYSQGKLPIRSNCRRANEGVRLINAEIADMPEEACGAEVLVPELTYAEPDPEFDEEGDVLDDGGLLSTDDSSSVSDTDF
ncbi:hypothetical protein GOP47_0018427 [Adiantum capillus-veneris]|uniref:Uncharacterized protein n=1 Tax=Adiantum capillus-veneris TaxID=13818 RepID=A0A9D4UD36_ADICA|nr:hypothetical protein GOP47_0018427 [Adiantum capillus-veneris]